MKKQILNCAILGLGLAVTQTVVFAQATPGIEGVWLADVTPVDCQTALPIPGALSFRGLYMFSHNGSLTNDAAFRMPTPRRGAGVGAWQHAQTQTYTAAFRFFRYNQDGSFLTMRRVTFTIVLDGDQFTSADKFQDFDADNNPLPTGGCNIEVAKRLIPESTGVAPGGGGGDN